MTPFTIQTPDSTLADIRRRVAEYPWHAMPADDGWHYGANKQYMRELCDYWLGEYDWRAAEAELNCLPQYKAEVDGVDLHFVHQPAANADAIPLLILHGWPGSVVEFQHIIGALANPQNHGATDAPAFHVVAPSLPGFGFSGAPPRPWGPRKMAATLDKLMRDALGYKNYIAQGGDWGGAIASWLGFEHPACRAIHINIMTMRAADGPQTAEEKAWADEFRRAQIMENGYRTQQATKPNTLSYAMMDSAVGVAAWIVEKFNSWSDTLGDDVESAHSRDDLLTNVMVYLTSGCFATAAWIYYGRREEGGRVLSREGRRVEVPTAAALFPKEMLAWPPRSYAERVYNIVRWSEMPRGGHFAAMEEPGLLVDDVRGFVGELGGK